jgi:hypothetical protein
MLHQVGIPHYQIGLGYLSLFTKYLDEYLILMVWDYYRRGEGGR